MQSFYDLIAPFYRKIFAVSGAKIQFLEKYIPPAGRVLDLACGAGELAERLSNRGYELTALDNNEYLLRQIHSDKGIKEVCGDFKRIESYNLGVFDAVIFIGNSISYAGDEDDIFDLLKKIRELTAPDGYLIIQTINYYKLTFSGEFNLPEKSISTPKGSIIFKRKYIYRPPKEVLFNTEIILNGRRYSHREKFTLFDSVLQKILLKASGFKRVQLFGDFKGDAFNPQSPAIITLSSR